MNHVDLNHVLMTHRINMLATTLLVLGSVLCIALFLYSHQLSSETELLQIGMRQHIETTNKPRSNRPLLQSNAKADAEINDETIAANAAIKEIVLPWSALFKSLESVDSADVKLFVLEPNAKQRTLHITAIALDSDSMMRYVDELTQQSILKEVVLQSQETTDISGQKAIRFVIEAAWKI
jgi:Tfp pilus assembly protein PilN